MRHYNIHSHPEADSFWYTLLHALGIGVILVYLCKVWLLVYPAHRGSLIQWESVILLACVHIVVTVFTVKSLASSYLRTLMYLISPLIYLLSMQVTIYHCVP